MRTLDIARESWQEFKAYQTLDDVRKAVRLDGQSSISTNGSRSACWKAFLLFENVDTSSWPQSLASSRSAYNSLRTHFLRHLENPDELAATYDPLSEDGDPSSPWMHMREDEELRAEILQDVVRCMPENLYFRQPDTQRILLDILFVFCKLNPDVSYRQGMHELLAPILWVVERDAIELGHSSRILGGEDATIKAVFDVDFIEHDTFALFAQVMQSAKGFYEQTTHSGKENPMVARSRRIFDDYLPLVDDELATHLHSIDVVPQVFLMRWIRLLFGREFAFDDVLSIWDVFLAEDPSFELVDHLCLTMILRMRWQLMEADLNEALGILLRYPDIERDSVPQSLVLDALYLRVHMDSSGGNYLVYKYTGRTSSRGNRPATPPPIQRNITTFSGSSRPGTSGSPTRGPRQSRNIEAVLQTTAKNLYAQGEKLGIGRAVRNAVDEVHKKAQELRDAQTPSPPATWRQRSGQLPSRTTAQLQNRIQKLEDRSKHLAKLLEGAVGELWNYQRLVSEGNDGSSENSSTSGLEGLSVAIAKVQFVQVYLGDPALPLPDPETEPRASDLDGNPDEGAMHTEDIVKASESAQSEQESTGIDVASTVTVVSEQQQALASNHKPHATAALQSPADSKDLDEPSKPDLVTEKPDEESSALVSQTQEASGESSTSALHTQKPFHDSAGQTSALQPAPPEPTAKASLESIQASGKISQAAKSKAETLRPRPKLEESSYSWMLGQEPATTIKAASSKNRPPRRLLFGDQADSSPNVQSRRESTTRRNDSQNEEEAEFDMSSLRHGKGR